MWVLDHLEDVESDLSVFHRVDNFRSLPSVRFYALASRLVHYDGAVRHVLTSVVERQRADASAPQLRALPDISEFVGVSGPNSRGEPWIEYRGA